MPAAPVTVNPIPGITAPDSNINTLTRFACAGAAVVRLGATCDTAGAALTARVIFWDALGSLAASTSPVTFTADKVAVDGSLFLAAPDPDAWFPVGGPSGFSVHVDAVSAGTWTITPMAL